MATRGRRRGPRRPAPRARRAQPSINRAPPLPVVVNSEVTVVNGDRSSLTWKRYRLQNIDNNTGMCTVVGSDGKTRQFPRAVVKPKNWIAKLREFFGKLAVEKEHEHEVDFYAFSVGLELLGAPYSDLQCMKIFQTLDVRANGFIEFQQFINWMYGLGRHPDRAKLLTTLECIIGVRDWEQDRALLEEENGRNLPFYCFKKRVLTQKITQTDDQNHKNEWKLSRISWENSNENEIVLVPINNSMGGSGGAAIAAAAAPAAGSGGRAGAVKERLMSEDQDGDGDGSGDEKEEKVDEFKAASSTLGLPDGAIKVVRTFENFCQRFDTRLDEKKDFGVTPFRPCFPHEQNMISVIVMGPGETGKSAMLNKFVKGVFPHEYDPTITDHFRKSFVVDDESCVLEITDTAGQEEFASMRYEWLRDGVDVLILTFTRASRLTFLQWKEQIKIAKRMLTDVVWDDHKKEWRIQPREVPLIAVATKWDLYEDELEVDESEVKDAIDGLGGSDYVKYVECSAYLDDADDIRVDRAFELAVKSYREARKGKKAVQLTREQSILQRRDSLAQELQRTRAEQAKYAAMNCLHSCLAACPSLQKYIQLEEPMGRRLLVIGRVPKEKFPDDVAHPVFSVRHFMIKRHFQMKKFLLGMLMSLIFPIVLAIQTFVFVFYNEKCGCNRLVMKLPEWDYNDGAIQILFDFLAPIVGRDPRDEARTYDLRLWFVSQTVTQKIVRLILSPFIIGLFFFSFYNAFAWSNSDLQLLNDGDESNDEESIATMEIIGPVVLWEFAWFIISFYMALDIEIFPEVPSLQELRPFVLYLGDDESIRTTAYVFLRGFAKSTLQMLRLEATPGRIITAAIIAIVYALIPGLTRIVDDRHFFVANTNYETESINALVTNIVLVFVLSLCLQMQLLSGLQNYVEWMDDVTSLLDKSFAEARNLPYLSMVRQSNAIGWIEMRTYLYTQGLIVFSRQEIFVSSMLSLCLCLAVYLLYRAIDEVIKGNDPIYKSESANGIFFGFLVLCYAMLRLLRTVKIVERLQEKQEALLSNQKLKIYYRRITYHPSNNKNKNKESSPSLSKNNNNIKKHDTKQDSLDQALAAVTNVPFDDSDDDGPGDGIVGLGTAAKNFGAALAGTLDGLLSTTGGGVTKMFKSNISGEEDDNQEVGNGGIALLSVQNEEYLNNSETLLNDFRNLVHSQDLIPRLCNIEERKVIGTIVFSSLFSVILVTMIAFQAISSDSDPS